VSSVAQNRVPGLLLGCCCEYIMFSSASSALSCKEWQGAETPAAQHGTRPECCLRKGKHADMQVHVFMSSLHETALALSGLQPFRAIACDP